MARVLVVANFGRFVMNMRGALLRCLRAAGHEVFFCAPPEDAALAGQLAAIGVHFEPLEVERTGKNPWNDLRYFLRLVRLIRARRPDKVVAFSSKPIIYASLATRLFSSADSYSVITGLGYAFSGESRLQRSLAFATRLLYRVSIRSNTRVFFQNEDDIGMFLANGIIADRQRVIRLNGSGVDVEAFASAGLPQESSFLLIARMVREKGILEYVEAARILKRKYPRVRARLAGWFDSNPGAISREQVAQWEKEGVVEFLGYLEDVRPALAATDIYVLPSYREGTPRTVLEAMAMGRPVITSDAPGCRETVEQGRNGLLVPTRDVPALVAAMERFVIDPRLAATMGAESRRIAAAKFDVRRVNEDMLLAVFDSPALRT